MSAAEVTQYAGVGLIVTGVAFVYWPLALIVAGIALTVLAQAGGD